VSYCDEWGGGGERAAADAPARAEEGGKGHGAVRKVTTGFGKVKAGPEFDGSAGFGNVPTLITLLEIPSQFLLAILQKILKYARKSAEDMFHYIFRSIGHR
jgi:hypothetical protein